MSIVQQPSQENAEHFGIRALWGGTSTLSSMIEVDHHIQSSGIKPVISKIFENLKQAAEAQNYSQKGDKEMGKIVLKLS